MTVLKEFLQAWLDWAEAGASDDHPQFSRFAGLCTNALYYESGAQEALKAAFVEDGLDSEFPFGEQAYWAEISGYRHQNPVRLTWVRAQLEKL